MFCVEHNRVTFWTKSQCWFDFRGVVENEKFADILSFIKGQEEGDNLLIYLKFSLVDFDY